ncbi:MAG: hypothetical protein PHC28_05870 [Flavobacterium sp.]|uniref:hypothetical protein n=1 Tax=Flavobacterium sp. TaxID=239 RepID=UPI00262BB0D2|nr:hypothetical protein [Flavobacterium sp.]MDD5149996.1 hypothetical protein [Flavobacterium sp.]
MKTYFEYIEEAKVKKYFIYDIEIDKNTLLKYYKVVETLIDNSDNIRDQLSSNVEELKNNMIDLEKQVSKYDKKDKSAEVERMRNQYKITKQAFTKAQKQYDNFK